MTALERGLTILQALGGSERALTLQEVASRARVPKTTAFRLLATLQGRDFIARTPEGRYRLGLRAIRLGHPAGGGIDLRRTAQPVLQRLSLVSEDTVNLAQWHDGRVVYVDVIPSPRPLRFVEGLGSIAPLHATALGKAVAAHLPDDDVVRLIGEAGLPRFTPRTITVLRRFLQEIRRVRRRGYALDREEKDLGAACVAAPVFNARGVVGAISISGPAARLDARRMAGLIPPLLEACAGLSRQLGGPAARRRRGRDGMRSTAGRAVRIG